jgi:hypothetical protein
MYVDDNPMGAPLDWQIELLRRFTAVAPEKEHPLHDERQLDLFK